MVINRYIHNTRALHVTHSMVPQHCWWRTLWPPAPICSASFCIPPGPHKMLLRGHLGGWCMKNVWRSPTSFQSSQIILCFRYVFPLLPKFAGDWWSVHLKAAHDEAFQQHSDIHPQIFAFWPGRLLMLAIWFSENPTQSPQSFNTFFMVSENSWNSDSSDCTIIRLHWNLLKFINSYHFFKMSYFTIPSFAAVPTVVPKASPIASTHLFRAPVQQPHGAHVGLMPWEMSSKQGRDFHHNEYGFIYEWGF